MPDFTRELISNEPRQFWLLYTPEGQEWPPPFDWNRFLVEIDPTYMIATCLFRAVEISRLPTVLKSGIDTEPPDAPIFADDFERAWKYGGWPKLVMALDPECMKRSWRTISKDVAQAELEQLKLTYPTARYDDEGSHIWLSRLPDSETRAGTEYEKAYGFWLPSRQLEALRALFVIARPTDYVQLYAWASYAECNALRDRVAAKMAQEQRSEAQSLAKRLTQTTGGQMEY
jgi:hypothetical protein